MRMRVRPSHPLVLAVVLLGAVLPLAKVFAARNSHRAIATAVADPDAASAEAARFNSLGVAYMGQQRFGEAQKQFEAALKAQPGYALAKLNLGIAYIAQQKSDEAKAALLEATAKLPNDPFGWYNLGLVYKDTAEHEKAIDAFQHVTKLAPNEPDAFYFIGYLNTQLQKYDDAIAAYKSALAIFPYHASAEFGLAKAYQRKGDTENAKDHLQKFQKMTAAKVGTPFGAGYGDQGKFSQAEYSKNGLPKAPAAIPVKFTPQPLPAAQSMGACFLDYDGDGKPDLLLVSFAGIESLPISVRLLHNAGDGKFEDVTNAAGITLKGHGLGCAAGDYDNDGKTDFAVCTINDGVHLFHNDGGGKFSDVTKTVGIKSEAGCAALTFVDYDHDGDLDLYVTGSARTRPNGEQPGMTGPTPGVRTAPIPNNLWRNNGNSTFADVTKETALGFDSTSGTTVTDFNNDRAIDFVLAGGAKGASILLNPREGTFTPLDGIDFAKEHLPPAVGVVAFDFDKDGWMDLAFTHSGAPGISLWRNKEGRGLERVALPDFGWKSGAGIAAVDYDNDGWIDLVAVGEGTEPSRPLGSEGIQGHNGQVRLLRNLGEGKFADVTKETKLDAVELATPIAIAAANVSGNGAMDLVVTQAYGPPLLLKNEGAEKNGWIELDLKALNDNKSAIGTKVEVYAGELAQKFEVAGASGYLSQNALPVHAGLGSEKGADVVRLLWPTGVPQDEIKLDGRKTQQVAELDRRGSSCPILFAWNGKEYEFIADMIGPGVVGHWVAPGERDVPDPTEYLKVPAKSAQPRDGMLSFRFLEPMEETVYLDQVKLLAIDHPASYDVYPNERFAATPPFPEFGVVPVRNAHAPLGAWDDRGHDVLPLLAKRDRKYVTDFDAMPFTGFAKLHWVELDLGEWNPRLPLRLILDGYTDYFTATSMYAADQAGVKVIPPYVEALEPATCGAGTDACGGKWVRVVDDMGFPAGLERTMVADLTGKLPAGTRRIRIANNLKIYWDAIRIEQTPEQKSLRVTEVPLAHAALEFLGFPKEIRLTPASDTVYSYGHRSKTGPYARAAGNYTRYGDVKPLLGAADDRFAIFSSGEGVKLDFDARRLPALPAGWVRDYFFMADGFEKDMDFYAAHAFTVEPLPKHSMKPYPYAASDEYPSDAAHLGYELDYNTRSRSGAMPGDLRYHFQAVPDHRR